MEEDEVDDRGREDAEGWDRPEGEEGAKDAAEPAPDAANPSQDDGAQGAADPAPHAGEAAPDTTAPDASNPDEAPISAAPAAADSAPGVRPTDPELITLVYDELRRRARRLIACEPAELLKQATSLVNDIMAKFIASGGSWEDERHFIRAAAIAMKHYLVDEARKRQSERHGGGHDRVYLDLDALPADDQASRDRDILDLALALDRLESRNTPSADRMRDVAHLKYFVGLSDQRTAAYLRVSEKTVERDWEQAKVWLKNEILRIRQSRGEADGG